MSLRFRYVIYGDIFTNEENDKGLAREEAERKLDNITHQLPNAHIDSLDLLDDILKGNNKEG